MIENIKIYIRSSAKIYVCIDEEIFYHEEELEAVLETLKEEYGLEEKRTALTIILHFSYFLFDNKKMIKDEFEENDENTDENKNFEKRSKTEKNVHIKEVLNGFMTKNISSVNKKLYLNYIENKYIDIYLAKKKISELEGISKRYGFTVEKIKMDLVSIYNFHRDENIEIIQIGEEESIKLTMQNAGITDIEKIELSINDVFDIENFDFGNMKVFAADREDIKNIFQGSELYDEPDFKNKSGIISMESIKSIKKKDIITAVVLMTVYFVLNSLIPLKKEIERNEQIKRETKELEKEYLNKKNIEIPEYSKELEILREIDASLRRKEYFSVIKFLIDNSEYGIDYTKIGYENKKWTIQGEMSDFDKFENFEKNILDRYKKAELGYIKDNDTETVFEYNILE